jgi:hypothetical protein
MTPSGYKTYFIIQKKTFMSANGATNAESSRYHTHQQQWV